MRERLVRQLPDVAQPLEVPYQLLQDGPGMNLSMSMRRLHVETHCEPREGVSLWHFHLVNGKRLRLQELQINIGDQKRQHSDGVGFQEQSRPEPDLLSTPRTPGISRVR